jgi:hypothetical protein
MISWWCSCCRCFSPSTTSNSRFHQLIVVLATCFASAGLLLLHYYYIRNAVWCFWNHRNKMLQRALSQRFLSSRVFILGLRQWSCRLGRWEGLLMRSREMTRGRDSRFEMSPSLSKVDVLQVHAYYVLQPTASMYQLQGHTTNTKLIAGEIRILWQHVRSACSQRSRTTCTQVRIPILYGNLPISTHV